MHKIILGHNNYPTGKFTLKSVRGLGTNPDGSFYMNYFDIVKMPISLYEIKSLITREDLYD